ENIIKSSQRTLRRHHDWDIETYTDPLLALKRVRTCIFDLVLSDCRMPGIDGIAFLSELRQLQPDAIRMVLTGAVNINTLLDAINSAGAFRFIAKPWDDDNLIQSINEGLRFRRIMVENRMLAEKVKEQEDELKKKKKKKAGAAQQKNGVHKGVDG
ncbi:response regulator, partial [candidate division KSB1 bacterium]|nr:response regulator [candidate division KSB1 bacterium]